MVIHPIDMVILDIDMGYGLMIWEMTVSIWSSSVSIWDILLLYLGPLQHSVAVHPHCRLLRLLPGASTHPLFGST